MRHRKLGGFNQTFHRRLRQGEFDFTLPVVQVREVGSRQRRERKTAAPRTHQNTVAFQLNSYFCAFRQPTTNIKELPRRNRGCPRIMRLRKCHARDHFHFEVCSGQRQRTVSDLKQQVSKNRQCRAAT
ncbi:hypothetical protein D3C86_1615500 [compost metagenome]